VNIIPFKAGHTGTAEDSLLGTEPVATIVEVGADPIPPFADAKEVWGDKLKLLKLVPNNVPSQPKPSGGHMPGVGQAVTYSVVKTVVVPTDPGVWEVEHAPAVAETTGGDS
jgi:hypothetical protein